jgi:hypothetical protein
MFADIGDLYQEGIVDAGKQPELFMLLAFLLAFGFIRTSAHLIRDQVPWWPGNVEVKGTHIHHLVWGILLMIVVGYAAIAFEPGSPWVEAVAILFGIGMGLTLDEFALWLNLEDVYWSEKGRRSIDAVVVTATLGLVLLLGVSVWIDVADDAARLVEVAVGSAGVAGVALGVVNALKEKPGMAIASLVFVPVGLVGALRLGRPRSPWARLFYRCERRSRAEGRFEASAAKRSASTLPPEASTPTRPPAG